MFSNILPTLGIDVRFVDGEDPAEFAAAADDKTRAFFCEGVSNPSLTIFDIEGIVKKRLFLRNHQDDRVNSTLSINAVVC